MRSPRRSQRRSVGAELASQPSSCARGGLRSGASLKARHGWTVPCPATFSGCWIENGWLDEREQAQRYRTSTVHMLQEIRYSSHPQCLLQSTSTVPATVAILSANLVYPFSIQRPRQQGTVLFIRASPSARHRISVQAARALHVVTCHSPR
jgi:hypothetical protein